MNHRVDHQRIALVIGNSRYLNEHGNPDEKDCLANAESDAREIAIVLDRLGFQVNVHYNLDRKQLRDEIMAFCSRAGSAAMAVTFYAGHGIEYQGRNYLLPTDMKLHHARSKQKGDNLSLEQLACPLNWLELAPATKLTLLILDACRDNGLQSETAWQSSPVDQDIGSPRGVAPSSAPPGTAPLPPNFMIAYAAKDGQQAWDGQRGKHSPFAKALLDHIDIPGLGINRLFARVRDEVFISTKGRQQPFQSGSIGGKDSFLRDVMDDDDRIFMRVDSEAQRSLDASDAADAIRKYSDFADKSRSSKYVEKARTLIEALRRRLAEQDQYAEGSAHAASHSTDRRYLAQDVHPDPTASITGLAFTRGGRRIISASKGRWLRVWDWHQDRHSIRRSIEIIDERRPAVITALAVDAVGSAAIAGFDDGKLRMVEFDHASAVRTCRPHSGEITALTLTTNSKTVTVLSACKDGSAAGTRTDTLTTEKVDGAHSDWVLSIALSSKDDHALTGARDGTVKLWRLSEEARRPHVLSVGRGAINAVGFIDDRRAVWIESADPVVKRFDLEAMRPETDLTRIHAAMIKCMAVSADGRWILTGDAKGMLNIWDGHAGRWVDTLQNSGTPITQVALSHDGLLALSGDERATVKLWDLAGL